MELKPLTDLTVADAYELLSSAFGQRDLPTLDAIENEDWGRDYLLSRLHDLDDGDLAAAGLTRAPDEFNDSAPESA